MYVENLLFFCSSISILFFTLCIVILFCLLQVSYLTFAFWHFLIELFEFSLWLHCFRYKTFSSIIPMHELNDWFVSNFHQHCSFPWHCHKIFLCTWIFIVAYFSLFFIFFLGFILICSSVYSLSTVYSEEVSDSTASDFSSCNFSSSISCIFF